MRDEKRMKIFSKQVDKMMDLIRISVIFTIVIGITIAVFFGAVPYLHTTYNIPIPLNILMIMLGLYFASLMSLLAELLAGYITQNIQKVIFQQFTQSHIKPGGNIE